MVIVTSSSTWLIISCWIALVARIGVSSCYLYRPWLKPLYAQWNSLELLVRFYIHIIIFYIFTKYCIVSTHYELMQLILLILRNRFCVDNFILSDIYLFQND